MATWRSSRRPSPELSLRPPRSNVSVRRGIAHEGSPAAAVSAQLALEDLARRVARELIHENDVAGHLVARQVGAHMVLQLGCADLAPRVKADEGTQPLAELLVTDADDRHLTDPREPGEQILDLAGEDVLTAGHDHVVVAAIDEQPLLSVEVTDVSRCHQAPAAVLVASAGVALEQHLGADEDPARGARRDLLPTIVQDPDHGAAGRPPGGARRRA